MWGEPEQLRDYGVSMEALRSSTIEDHRNKIAQKIGGAWESLATFIRVPSEDVDDIKEKYREPRDRRLAMMRRWHELWGEEATYLKLIEGLKQIGRRDLIEIVVGLLRHGDQQPANEEPQSAPAPLHNNRHNFQFSCLRKVGLVRACLLVVLILTIGLMWYDWSMNDKLSLVEHYNNSIISTRQNQDNITTHQVQKTTTFDRQGIRNCSFPENDLPIIHPLFIGRENDVYQVLHRVANAHIVNINGAPGFGKSTLAIHVGYEIFKNGTSVRYINVDKKVFSILNQIQKSEGEAMPEFSSNTNIRQALTNSLIEFRSSLSIINQNLRNKNGNFFEELQRWSETIKCTSILILDNCDDILATAFRHEFISLINLLVTKSQNKLRIIIVSRERLLYLDSFDCWTVRELNQSASVQLLDTLAPAINNESLTTVAELVEGCPLALKVIGQLLHIHGVHIIHQMKKKMMNVLDRVSVYERRFRVIMDIAFNRLGVLKDCGYILSLFPGSFDETAGNAIVQEECLETHLRHSLLNDYYLAFNYRYKMHRLIREYLQEKISVSDNTTFITRFREHFETLLLIFAKKQEIDDSEKYILSLELHNFHYLNKLLLIDLHPSSEELAILALLVDMKFIQLEQPYSYYALYIKKVYEVCQLLNSKLCGQLYTYVVRHLYQQCKCETIMAYFQNWFVSPCMEHFQCEVVSYLKDLHTLGVLQLSDSELSYLDVVVGSYCNTGHGYRAVGFVLPLNLFIFAAFDAYGVKCMICVLVTSGFYELASHIFYESDIDIVTVPHLRILEITLFWSCQYAIIVIAVFFMYTAVLRMGLFTRESVIVVIVILYYYLYCSLYSHT